jgi:integrase
VEEFRSAYQCSVVEHNPCGGVKVPRRAPHDAVVLEPAQIAALARAIREPYGTLIDLLAYSALRFGEAVALRRDRVRIGEGRLLVTEAASKARGHRVFGRTKTYGVRVVAVPPFLRDEPRMHLDDHVATDPTSLIFAYPRGGPLRIANLSERYFRPAVERAGLPAAAASCSSHGRDVADRLRGAPQGGATASRAFEHRHHDEPVRASPARSSRRRRRALGGGIPLRSVESRPVVAVARARGTR